MALTPEEQVMRQTVLSRDLMITDVKDSDDAYVFVSYKSSDWRKVFEGKIIPLQKEYALRVYCDKNFDDSNEPWLKNMEHNIKRASAFLLFISEDYLTSYATLIELLTAIQQGIPMIPIYMENKDALFSRLDRSRELDRQTVNMSPSEARRLTEVMESCKKTGVFRDTIDSIKNRYNSKVLEEDVLKSTLVQIFMDLLDDSGRVQDNSYETSNESLMRTILDAAKKAGANPFGKPQEQASPSRSEQPSAAEIWPPVSVPEPVPEAAAAVRPMTLDAEKPGFSMTLAEFRAYVAEESHISFLQERWSAMDKLPGYVMFAALLGGPGISGQARKNLVTEVFRLSSNGIANAGTWTSAVAACINGSRKLESVKDVYPALPQSMTVAQVRERFEHEDGNAFVSAQGKKQAILCAFDRLFL